MVSYDISYETGQKIISTVFVLYGQSGMAYDFLICQGSAMEINQEVVQKFGFGSAVVLHLAKRIANPAHKLYFDNNFSTLRVNRFALPPFLSDK
jgi:methyl coenzyme M reductase subunit C